MLQYNSTENTWINFLAKFLKMTELCPFVEFDIFPTFEPFDLESLFLDTIRI